MKALQIMIGEFKFLHSNWLKNLQSDPYMKYLQEIQTVLVCIMYNVHMISLKVLIKDFCQPNYPFLLYESLANYNWCIQVSTFYLVNSCQTLEIFTENKNFINI